MPIIKAGGELWRVGPGLKPVQGPFTVTGHVLHPTAHVIMHKLKELPNYLLGEDGSFPSEGEAWAEAKRRGMA